MRVLLNGTSYQLYLQPVPIEDGQGVQLVLVGFVPTEQIVRRALAMDTYFVALLVFVLLLGVLGFPFLKLVSLHTHERLRLRDVYWLHVSTGALLALFTFALMAADGYTNWQRLAAKGLQREADDFVEGLVSEITVTRDQLIQYDEIVSTFTPPPQCVAMDTHSNWFSRARPGFPWPQAQSFLHFEQAAWVSPRGMQIWKITSDPIGRKVDVSERPYFRAVRDGNLYQVEGQGTPFFVAPDRSITDGKFYAFLAIRSRLGATPCPSASGTPLTLGAHVAVATFNLLSIDRPPLPAGYGFAIVTREGRVLWHSDSRLSLRENLFDELTAGSTARSVMYAGRADLLETRYRERPSQLYLTPLPLTRTGEQTGSAGLYLAMFREETLERAVVARAFITSMAGPLPLLTAFVVLGLWVMSRASVRTSGDLSSWLWPHGGLHSLYRTLTLVFLAAIAIAVAMRATVWAFVLPAFFILVGYLIYTRGPWQVPVRRKLGVGGWHAAGVGLLWLGVMVAPSMVLFRLTIGHEFGTLIKTEQTWMRQQEEDVVLRARAEARGEEHSEPIADRLALARNARLLGSPEPYSSTPDPLSPASENLVRVHEWLDHLVPTVGDATSRQEYQDAGVSFNPPGPVWMLSWFGLLGMAAMAVALLAWIRWSASHLFLADVDISGVEAIGPEAFEHAWNECSDRERFLLMQVTEERVATPQQRSAVLALLERGLLVLAPTLRPSSDAFEVFVREKQRLDADGAGELAAWEATTDGGHSWMHARTVLIVSMGGLAAFLLATQPALQSDLAGVATGVTAITATLVKLRDVARTWLDARGNPGP